MTLRGEPAKLSCFSWPSLWVFRLKWNPMGCELKLRNIFWKSSAPSSVRDQTKPPSLISWSSQRAHHFWAPQGGSVAPGREQWARESLLTPGAGPVPAPAEAGQAFVLGILRSWFQRRVRLCWKVYRSLAWPSTAAKQRLAFCRLLVPSKLKCCCKLRVWVRAWRC